MTAHRSWYAKDVRGWTCPAPSADAAAFHRDLPGYAPTALAEAPGLAAGLGVGRLFVKDESARFDLRAPDTAACTLASLAAGRPVSVPTGGTVMNGLNCGSPSLLAWPCLAGGLDAAITVTDDEARAAIEALAGAGLAIGPSGAAALAGLTAALTGPGADARRAGLGLATGQAAGGTATIAVCICTEGPLTG